MANLINALFNTGDSIDGTNVNAADTAHYRLDNIKVAIFSGATAAQRLAKYINTYVNQASLNPGGDAANPGDYTNTDLGIPLGCVLSIYYADGLWYLHFQDHNPYNAANMPFNKIPNPFDQGNAQ